MKTPFNKYVLPRAALGALFLLIMSAGPARAGIVTTTQVVPTEEGYEIEIEFAFQVRYQSHAPTDSGTELLIQLRPVNFQQLKSEQVQDLREREPLSWEEKTGIPLREMIVEGGDPEQPQISLRFTREVAFDVRGSANLRSLIITIKTEIVPGIGYDLEFSPMESPEYIIPENEFLAEVTRKAYSVMRENNYPEAIEYLKQVVEEVEGEEKEKLREVLGYTFEWNDQLESAKAQYRIFLEEYPDSPIAGRVERRLKRILAIEEVKAKQWQLKDIKKKLWQANYYGTLSEFFDYDQTTLEGSDTAINKMVFESTLDFNARARSKRFDVRSELNWKTVNRLKTESANDDYLNRAAVEARDKVKGAFGKVGRQWRDSGGALELFDGIHLAYDLTSKVVVNGILGYPVGDTSHKGVEDNRAFAGASVDLGPYQERWDFVLFVFNQSNQGLTDRRAVGGEVRYYDAAKSVFSSVDYDTFFERMNIFNMNGWWVLPSGTTLNVYYDYRRNPYLATNNATSGQEVAELSGLFDRFSDDELYQFAEDRTAISKTVSVGATQPLKEDVKVAGDVTVYEWEGTTASGGIEGDPGVGPDYFYSLQLLLNNALMKNDLFITGVKFGNAENYYSYTFTLSSQLPAKENLRVNPEIRFDYRDVKGSLDRRLTVRPSVLVDCRLKKWLRFETKAGSEWEREKTVGDSSKSTDLFITAGAVISY